MNMNENHPDKYSADLEIFVPSYNLQGDSIPFYITSKNKIESVVITYTSGLSIKELYNVNQQGIELGNSSITIHKLKIGGYLGGVFNSLFDKINYGKEESITFEVRAEEREYKTSRTIELFRPSISVKPKEQEIKISSSYDKETKVESYKVKDPITITNNGLGASLISIKTEGDDHVTLALPQDYLDLAEKLINDLDRSIEALGKKYPAYDATIKQMMEVMKNPFPSETTVSQYKESAQSFDLILESNPVFREEFQATFIASIFRDISLTKDLETFLAYLMSLKPHKIVLSDPLMRINLPGGKSSFNFVIKQTDVLKNVYKDIIKKVSIDCTKEMTIPISELFVFKGRDTE